MMKIIGVDIGGTNIDVVFFSDGKYRHIMTLRTENIDDICEKIQETVSIMDVDAVGIGVAAWLKSGNIIHAPNLPSPEAPLNLRDALDVPVFLDNDANCFAMFAHEILGHASLLAVTVGTGIGSGIIVNGEIYRGEGIAGEIGHWTTGRSSRSDTGKQENLRCRCGGKDHLECYFSGWALEQKYGKSVKDLMAENRNFIYETEGFDDFCRAIANAVMLLDPSAVVFGGRIGMQFDAKILENRIYCYLMRGFLPRIEVLKDEIAVAKGACILAASSML